MGPYAIILVFLMLNFKPAVLLFFFLFLISYINVSACFTRIFIQQQTEEDLDSQI